MLSKIKPLAEQTVKPVVHSLKGLNPNTLTLIGSIPPLLFFVFLIQHNYTWAIIVIPFFLIDLLDGAVARVSGKTSPFGEFLDSTIDRISDFLIISAFTFAGIVHFQIVLIFILAAFMVSYTRSRGELASNKRLIFTHGLMERTERIIGIVIALLAFIIAPTFNMNGYNITEIIFLILTLFTTITFLQRVFYAYKHL